MAVSGFRHKPSRSCRAVPPALRGRIGVFDTDSHTAHIYGRDVVSGRARADALRGGGDSPRHTRPPAHAAVSLPAPPPGALEGTLWYADADCHLHRIDLATGGDRLVTPSAGHCRFWLSPDRRYIAMHVG